MEHRRKQAYRYLLYRAMLDIRPICWMPLGSFNPFRWKETAGRVRRAGVIADWLHNLALFSALDFERFDEDWFWRELGEYDQNRTT